MPSKTNGGAVVAPASCSTATKCACAAANTSFNTTEFKSRLRSRPASELSGARPRPNGAVSMLVSGSGVTPMPMTPFGRRPGAPSSTGHIPMNTVSCSNTTGSPGCCLSASDSRACSARCCSAMGSANRRRMSKSICGGPACICNLPGKAAGSDASKSALALSGTKVAPAPSTEALKADPDRKVTWCPRPTKSAAMALRGATCP